MSVTVRRFSAALFWAVLCALFFVADEILYRAVFDIPRLDDLGDAALEFFLFALLLYGMRSRAGNLLILLFFAWSMLLQNVHYAVYRGWVTGMNYFLLFAEIGEVSRAGGGGMLPMLAPHVLWALGETALLALRLRFRPRFRQNPKAGRVFPFAECLFLLLIAVLAVRSYGTRQWYGIMPDTGNSRFKAHVYGLAYMSGKIIPGELFGLGVRVPAQKAPMPQIVSVPKVRNIVLIMGESESSAHVHAFGYPRDTSPFFDRLQSERKDVLLKSIYSAGKMTAVSLPMFFNMAERANAQELIRSGRRNLFRLAREQGFETLMFSAQPESEMAVNVMNLRLLDRMVYPSDMGHAYNQGMNDDELLPLLHEIDLSRGRHFVVLSQRGSHAPYGHYLSPRDRFFSGGTPLDEYDNTVRHTDDFIRRVYERLRERAGDDWLLIYTSDHGQRVTEREFNQGTVHADQYRVPLLIVASGPEVQASARRIFSSCPRSFHWQVAAWLGAMLGYDTEPSEECGVGVVLNNMLSGEIGWTEVPPAGDTKEVLP